MKNIKIFFKISVFLLNMLITQKGYSQASSRTKKNILILHTGKEERPWISLFNKSFKKELKNKSKAQIAIEYLDLKRFHTENYQDILEELMQAKYQNKQPDILVVTNTEAIEFVQNRKLFPEITKILVGIEESDCEKYDNVICIPFTNNFDGKIKHALDIFPETSEIFVVSGSSAHDNYILANFKSETMNLGQRVSFKYLNGLPKREIIATVKKLPEQSIVYFLPFTQQSDGRPIIAKKFSFELAKNASKPVFTFNDLLVEETGIFGGQVSSVQSIATKTIEIITQIFEGKNIKDIKPLKTPDLFIYDWNQLEKWNVDLDKLPKESEILNRSYTFFELYKNQVILGLILLSLYSFLLIRLLSSNRKRKKSEQDLIEKNKEIQEAKEKAEESDRLKSAFLANMSHEIRTPMNGILGFTNLLKEPGLTGEQQEKFISIIEKSGTRMLNTINDIVDISKIEAGQVDVIISEFDLNREMNEHFEFFLPEATKKNLQLSITDKVPEQLATIKTDKEKLNAILINFIKNAIKYTPSGTIEMGYAIRSKEGNKIIEFFVKDSGIGIPENRLNAVFDRFVQADIEDRQVYEGSGLGLAICKAYAEMLGGTIWAESELGVGSQFYFTIPYVSSQEILLKNNTEDSNDLLLIKKELNFLIVEDDEIAVIYLKLILEPYAKKLLVAKTGVDAVTLCRNNPELDIILMDIKLPGINGYETTKQIRKFNTTVFIMVQTAFVQSGEEEKAIAAGCDAYITKPIDKEAIENIILNRLKH